MDGSVALPRPLLALGLRLLTALTLSTMAMLIFWRQAITVAAVALLMAALGRLAEIRTRRFSAHARRAVYGITGMGFVYGAVILLPLAEATTLSFTTPIFAVLLALVLFLESFFQRLHELVKAAQGFDFGFLFVGEEFLGHLFEPVRGDVDRFEHLVAVQLYL